VKLIDSLQNPALYDHPVVQFEVIETHISWVLLTGPYAYKIKKPVNFGFLDFSSLEKRKHYCEEELRLNRRLAPQLYLDVVAIHGSEDKPNLHNTGPVIEYTVKMKQFPQSAQLDRLLGNNQLLTEHIDELAHTVAAFHQSIESVPTDSPYGDVEHITEPVLENFSQIRNCINDPAALSSLTEVEDWSKQQLDKLRETLTHRKQQGFIRQCHGDMHLRNIALVNDDIIIFDCIEFNTNFYLIDLMSEIAYLVMDLEDRQQHHFANRVLNTYLEITGDYEGLRVFNFYKVYRAVVRAKVDALRTSQEEKDSTEYKETFTDFMQYLQLAKSYTEPTKPVLLINHGLSGSGKTYGTRQLVEILPAIAIRSDIERKRLFEKNQDQHHIEDINHGLYSQQASEKTYQRLVELARSILASGYNVIIDAANLKQSQRQLFLELKWDEADALFGRRITILHYTASPDTLRERVKKRMKKEKDASDATLEILEHQLKNHKPLTKEELERAITINTEDEIDFKIITETITQLN